MFESTKTAVLPSFVMDVGSSVSRLVLADVDVGAPVLEDVHSFSSAVVALLSVRLKIESSQVK